MPEVRLPADAYATHACDLKVRDRSSYEFALVSVAAALHVENGLIREARLAAGGVGTKPWRLPACEAVLIGKAPNRAAYQEAAKPALEGASAVPGNRYKLDLLPRTICRALEIAGETV
jgi:xanthine dehydrogenase YagS FAD-binding subunit